MLAILQSLGTFFIDLLSRGAGLKPRTCFLVINSTSPCWSSTQHRLEACAALSSTQAVGLPLRIRYMRNAKACQRNDALRPVTPGLICIAPTRRQPWARAQSLYCWPFVRPECGPPLTLRTLTPALLSFHRILSTKGFPEHRNMQRCSATLPSPGCTSTASNLCRV